MTDDPSGDERPVAPSRRWVLRLAAAATGSAALGGAVTPAAANQSDPPTVPTTLPSARRLDREERRVTFPAYRGTDPSGDSVYFVLTATSHVEESIRQGVNWAPKLGAAVDADAVQELQREVPFPTQRREAPVRFDATVDFDPDRDAGAVGGVAEERYSPLVTTETGAPTRAAGAVYNAPHLVNSSGRHPAVVDFDRDDLEVRVKLSSAFVEERRALYLAAEASTEPYATLERATHTPALQTLPAPADRSLESSAREALLAVVNGPNGERNLQRQGTNSARAGEGDALYVARSSPECRDAADPTNCSVFYSPVWGVYEVAWTGDAIENDRRRRLTGHEAVFDALLAGELTSASPGGSVDTMLANLRASGAVVDAPIVDVSPTGSR